MSKKLSNDTKKQSSVEPVISEKTTNALWIKILLVLFVFVLYGSTVKYEFTLDDDLFYLKHSSVQKGLAGFSEFFSYGSLNKFDGTEGVQPYRPITLLYFGIQKALFDDSASAAHLFNVLLYAILVLVLFSLLQKLFPDLNTWFIGLMTLLFIAHPIHTEVICSVKSVDELLAGLFGFLAWLAFIQKEDSKRSLGILFGTMFYFLALMSKESAIGFLLIIPLSALMLKGKNIRQCLMMLAPLGIATILFLVVRYQVIGNQPAKNSRIVLENILYGATSLSETLATKMQILFYYIKLVFVPWPLNWDYSYNQIPVANWSNLTSIAGFVIYAALFIYAILKFRKDPVLSFCILFFFIASSPTNNLFFINGATIGERFLFVPSLALCVAIVWLLMKRMNGDFKKSAAIAAVVILNFTFLTFARSGDWENNQKLFERGVEVSPNSSRTHYSLATTYLNKAQEETDPAIRNELFKNATEHFQKSLSIYNKNTQAYYNCGLGLALTGDTSNAIYHYRKAIEYDSAYLSALNNVGVLYQARKSWDSAEVFYMMAHKTAPTAYNPRKNLADLYFFKGVDLRKEGKDDEALSTYRMSIPYNDKNVFLFNEMSVIFSNRKQYDSSLYYLKMAYNMDASSMMIIENIAAVNFLNKNYAQAIEYANKALQINSNSKKSYGVLADTYRAMGNAVEANKNQEKYNQLK